ncbi:extracellular solute-binding protein [Vogesella sp. LIG4]|uniref:extracellular solute-binding protein n=1 Tax=Vogesella sp. LIG4 TaxID=1192162 RepID=UPI000B5AE6C5|nr:extracellular solute-binding protein [Vogesella sp. LIG4]
MQLIDQRTWAVQVLLLALALPAHAEGVLRVLTWPGYADPDVVKEFEQRTSSKVEVTFVENDAELWRRFNNNNGADYDVLALNTAELQRYIQQRLVTDINTAGIPNLARQLPRFRQRQSIPGLVHGGKTYAIPYTYSEMGLIYDRKQFSQPPDSISVMWDHRYQGKVIAYNGGVHSFSLASQALGFASPFRIGEQQWPAAVAQLIALRRNVSGFYTGPEESVTMFKERHAALMFANFGSQQVQLLKAAGVSAGYIVPREGALAWLDCWAINRKARDPQLALRWINFLLEDMPGRVLLQRQGLANTTSPSPYFNRNARIVWLEPPESEEKRDRLWLRILAGDRASKVLQP